MSSNLEAVPNPPKQVTENAVEDVPVVPIVMEYSRGDVLFAGLDNQNLMDFGHGGEHDLVFDSICSDIDRFAVHNDHGNRFVLGWLYRSVEKENAVGYGNLSTYIRDEVKAAYPVEEAPDNPMETHERYDAYEHL